MAGSMSSTWTKPAPREVHARLVLAFAPEGDGDVADPHGFRHAGAPGGLQAGAEGGLPSPGFARDEDALHGGGREVDPARGRPFGEVERVGRRAAQHGGLEELDGGHEALGVPRAHRDVADAEAGEGVERDARDEGAGVVGGDHALAPRRGPRRRRSAGRSRPRCRGRTGSAGCSSACRSCRWWSRCGRCPPSARRGGCRWGGPRRGWRGGRPFR